MQHFQVKRSDKTTKICENCWCEIRHSIEFLDICATANGDQTTGSLSNTDAIDEFIERQDETDSENDEANTDQQNAFETRTIC